MAKTRIASWSEVDTARQCLYKHGLGYQERWVGGEESLALARGTLYHGCMEILYNLLMQRQAAEKAGEPCMTDEQLLGEARLRCLQYLTDNARNSEEVDLLMWMFDGHVELYGTDEQWKILAVELNREVWLPTPNGTRSSFKAKMKIDLVVKDKLLGGIWIVDHKSGKDLPKKKELDMSDQFGLYEFGLRQLGHQIRGTIYSAARTQRNKDQSRHPQPLVERFSRIRMPRTDRELQEIAVEAYRTLRIAYSMPPEDLPRSPNPDTCKWKCDFTEACLAIRKGAERPVTLRGFGFKQDFTRH